MKKKVKDNPLFPKTCKPDPSQAPDLSPSTSRYISSRSWFMPTMKPCSIDVSRRELSIEHVLVIDTRVRPPLRALTSTMFVVPRSLPHSIFVYIPRVLFVQLPPFREGFSMVPYNIFCLFVCLFECLCCMSRGCRGIFL